MALFYSLYLLDVCDWCGILSAKKYHYYPAVHFQPEHNKARSIASTGKSLWKRNTMTATSMHYFTNFVNLFDGPFVSPDVLRWRFYLAGKWL